jgi:hypothetical protein
MQKVISLEAYKQLGKDIRKINPLTSITVSEDTENLYTKLTVLFFCCSLIDSIESSVITRYTLFWVTSTLRLYRRSLALKISKLIISGKTL